MVTTCPLPPTVTSATTPCDCGGQITVYLLSRPVDWANTSDGLVIDFEAEHRTGPHACQARGAA
jgi:hypothetical protein